MPDKYRLNSDFEVPEPTPATHFSFREDVDDPERRQEIIKKAAGRMFEDMGGGMVRVTVTGPNAEDDQTGYPHGLWFEGWPDRNARQWPFGKGYPDENGAVYPPLTANGGRP